MNLYLKVADWGNYVPAEDHERMLELTRNGSNVKDDEGNILKIKMVILKKIIGIKCNT